MPNSDIRLSCSLSQDEDSAAKELFETLHQENAALVVFFCSALYDLNKLASAINKYFGTTPVIGCTSAGEIGPEGYTEHSITGFSLGPSFDVRTRLIEPLDQFNLKDGHVAVQEMQAALNEKKSVSSENCFGFLLVDGLSIKEEQLITGIYSGIGDLSIFGGSAGDQLEFKHTYIFEKGQFKENCAVLTLIQTDRPFKVFKTQHYVESDKKLVVTEANPENRTVAEINGEIAAEEYAKLIGKRVDELGPTVFASYPLVLKSGKSIYVRSIQEVIDDGGLKFYCAIDEGIVLTIAEGVDIKHTLEHTLEEVSSAVGEAQLIIGCDCILRRLEITDREMLADIGAVMSANRVIGFSTYGEQYQAMHINQTLTGVAIG